MKWSPKEKYFNLKTTSVNHFFKKMRGENYTVVLKIKRKRYRQRCRRYLARLHVVPIFPQRQWSEQNACARENHPMRKGETRRCCVGWFSCVLAFRSLYHPWEKMGTTRRLLFGQGIKLRTVKRVTKTRKLFNCNIAAKLVEKLCCMFYHTHTK